MANKIQLRRGLKSKLPTLSLGEMGLCTDTHEMYIGNNGNIRISNRRTATKVIGNSSAGYNAGDVDYLVSGTSNAASVIQSAISALPSSGGKIIFLEGTYSITSAFSISKNVVFEGMGDGTQINVSGSLATCSSSVNIVFRDMKITANSISKYLYKGGGSDNVLLDNVTLTMTATGTHNLTTTDTYAAFIGVNSFTADKSRISLTTSCRNHTSDCFSIVDKQAIFTTSDDFISVRCTGCKIELNATNGNAHISRGACNISCSEMYLTQKSEYGYAAPSYHDWGAQGGDATFFGCRIILSGTNNDFTGMGAIVGSHIISKFSGKTSLWYSTIVGCHFDTAKINVTGDRAFGNY